MPYPISWEALLNEKPARSDGAQRAKRRGGQLGKRRKSAKKKLGGHTNHSTRATRRNAKRGALDGAQILALMISNKAKFSTQLITRSRFFKQYYSLRAQFYASDAWKRLRISIIARDKTCICGSKIQEVHHKKYLFDHPELGLDRKNLVGLCIDCHVNEHKR